MFLRGVSAPHDHLFIPFCVATLECVPELASAHILLSKNKKNIKKLKTTHREEYFCKKIKKIHLGEAGLTK